MDKIDIEVILLTGLIIFILTILYFLPQKKLFGLDVWYKPKRLIACNQKQGGGVDKQIFDIYSFSHITHGIILYFFINYIDFPDVIKEYGLWIALILEILWEVFENSNFIINRYSRNKEFSKYNGDSIANILGDILMMIFGYYTGIKIDKYSLIYVLLSEIILYFFKANLIFLSLGSLIFGNLKLF